IGKLSHRTSIKDGLGRHIGSCGPLNRNFLKPNGVEVFNEYTEEFMTVSSIDEFEGCLEQWKSLFFNMGDFSNETK
ncbi:hypothetical protein P9955_14855, partial [Serratia nevei]|nr:hypothetical protein [Serratia nevei]MDK5273993.1 hypothetical protein [Serratia nevei]